MHTLFKKGLLMSLGLISMTVEKTKNISDKLIQRGENRKDEAKEWVEQLAKRGDEEREAIQNRIHDELKEVINELGLATKQDIQELINKIEAITNQEKS